MGLAGGEHGAKAVFRDVYSAAWKQFRNLQALQEGIDTSPREIVTVLDGNVVLMSAPAPIVSLRDYVDFFRKQINGALAASAHVVVVFDEPEHLTRAKQAEQRRRDSSRRKTDVPTSDDLAPLATDDNWQKDSLRPEDSVRLLFGHRAARQRAIDLIATETMRKLDAQLSGQRQRGEPPQTVTFDGVDWRGADRPVGSPRVPGVIGTDDRVAEVLERDEPVGEGDLKLTAVSSAVERGRLDSRSPFHGIEVVLVVTIDTDSLVIELGAQARRVEEGVSGFSVFLCLRERAAKREIGEEPTHSYLNVADVEVLQEEVLEDLFSRPYDQISMPLRRKGVALLTLGMAACGCDFCGVKGLRAREMIDVLRSTCSDEPYALSRMDTAWSASEHDLLKIGPVLRALLQRAAAVVSEQPRRKKAADSLTSVGDADVLKCLWTTRYWNCLEIKNIEEWGFGGTEFASIATSA